MTPKRKRRVARVIFETYGPTRTKQSFKNECDINGIMQKFERTGVIEHVRSVGGSYSDFTDLPQDYHAAVNQVMAAEEMFQTVPAKIRARFNNDPGEFLAFVEDPSNVDELVRLGLARASSSNAPKPEPGGEPGPTPGASPEPRGDSNGGG